MSSTGHRFRTRYAGLYYRLNAKGERRYQIAYKDSFGKRVFKTVDGTERDALRERNQILERMHRGEKVVSSKLTIKDLSADFLRTQTGHMKEGTVEHNRYCLDRWVIPKIGHLKVSEVDVNDIADYVAEMRQEYAPATIKNCLTPLSRMFQYAVRRGWMSRNPVSQLDAQERPGGSPRKMRILSEEEIQKVLAYKTVYRLLFLTAIFTGLRKGELLSLTWADVDLLRATINVREGKTNAAAREVVLPDFLVKALAKEMKTEGVVFPFTERNVKRALDRAIELAKIEHLRFHDLRHTFASILISQGMDPVYVADQMGHANPGITFKTYAKLYDAAKRRKDAREKMDTAFREVVG